MELVDIIIIALIMLIVGAASWYVYRSRKSGKKCIGCPDGCSCASKESAGCGCGCSGSCPNAK